MPLPKHLQEEFEKEFHFDDAENPINIDGTALHDELLAFLSHVWEEGYKEGYEDAYLKFF